MNIAKEIEALEKWARSVVAIAEDAFVQTPIWRERATIHRMYAEKLAALRQRVEGAAGPIDYVPGELDRTAPERIWLQIDTGGDNAERDEPWPGADGVTWQDEEMGGLEIQYIRADLAAPAAPTVPEGWRDDVALAAQMLTWGWDSDGLGHSEELQIKKHQAKLLAMLEAAPAAPAAVDWADEIGRNGQPTGYWIRAAAPAALDVDGLAQEIRRVDGNHRLGAGALAEALMPFLASRAAPAAVVDEAMVERACVASIPGWEPVQMFCDRDRMRVKNERERMRRALTAALSGKQGEL